MLAHRSLLRRLITTLSILSLLLCLATVTLWVRSYGSFDELKFASPHDIEGYFFRSTHGGLTLSYHDRFNTGEAITRGSWSHTADEPFTMVEYGGAFGFDFHRGSPNEVARYSIALPHWSLAALFALLPTWRFLALLPARRRATRGFPVITTAISAADERR